MSSERDAEGSGSERLTTPSRGRARQQHDPSMAYSDWHREELPSWYPCIDVDLIEFDRRSGEPYLLAEIVTISSPVGLSKPTKTHPLTEFKAHAYGRLADLSGLPAYTIYCTPDVAEREEVVVHRIDADESPCRLVGMNDLCDWLDDLATRVVPPDESS